MPALEAGTQAPPIELPTVSGRTWSLADARKRGAVVLAFFKINCPICQETFPYLERIHRAYPNEKAQFVGVSQDPKRDTEAFLKEYGVSFTTVLDDTRTYPVSNAYGLTNVPTIFVISEDGEIELASVGWYKKDIETLNLKMAQVAQMPWQPAFRPGEEVQEFRPG